MAFYNNNTGEVSRIGLVAIQDPRNPNGFTYASPNSAGIIGIISQSVQKYSRCNIIADGNIKVFCSSTVTKGSVIRLVKAGDNLSRATCTMVKSIDSGYLKIGTALESGKGLINCSLSISYVGETATSTSASVVAGITNVTTGSYVVKSTDKIIVVNSVNNITIFLPSATASGRNIQIANINIGTVTVDGHSSDTINGETTQPVYQDNCIDVRDFANNKWVII